MDRVRILSQEHGAYWRADGGGYTTRKAEAWVLSREEARRITKHCGPEKMIFLETALDSHEDRIAALEVENAALKRERDEALRKFIDISQQYCEGCGHYFIDVTATRDPQLKSHALDGPDDGDLSVCARCLVSDARTQATPVSQEPKP